VIHRRHFLRTRRAHFIGQAPKAAKNVLFIAIDDE
jgi:hypothetical protein